MKCCIAVDAMGGDFAPQVVIDGLATFHKKEPEVFFLVFGDEEILRAGLGGNSSLAQRCQVIHTAEVVSDYAKASQAVRTLPRSSMRLALEAVAQRQAQGVVSAGNTGAYLALSKLILKTIGGIDRPAIASQLPTKNGCLIMLDLGGMLEASSRNLMEYALMGSVFANRVLGIESPSIGLLNVGREETKGNDCLQQAFLLLKNSHLNFHGFIEGHDIAAGTVDVVVTDGFTGNIALKSAEGIANLCLGKVREALKTGWRGRLAGFLARPCLRQVLKRFDPREYNGAMWLGLNGVAIKSHGGSDALAFARALGMAHAMIQKDIISCIAKALEKVTLEEVEGPLEAAGESLGNIRI